MSRLHSTCLLLTLVAGFYLYPLTVEAKDKTAIPIFVMDQSLTASANVDQAPSPDAEPASQPSVVPAQTRRAIPNGYNPCSCVSWAKYKTGFSQSIGAAHNWPVNSDQPAEGAVIITYESGLGHVGIVSHWDDTYVYLGSEANFTRCRISYGRKLPINSKVIKGYWIP